jgi:hypothetical protein
MNAGEITINLLIGVFGTVLTALLLRVYALTKSMARRVPLSHSHFRFYRGRAKFNELGTEILNGAVATDTVYIVLRSGTFISHFAGAISKFREHRDTRLIVVVPDQKVFLANFGGALRTWITDLYENPDCAGMRALLLEPGAMRPSETRKAGYLFASDGHNHDDDEGFYTASPHSSAFLHGYVRSLVRAGTPVPVPLR